MPVPPSSQGKHAVPPPQPVVVSSGGGATVNPGAGPARQTMTASDDAPQGAGASREDEAKEKGALASCWSFLFEINPDDEVFGVCVYCCCFCCLIATSHCCKSEHSVHASTFGGAVSATDRTVFDNGLHGSKSRGLWCCSWSEAGSCCSTDNGCTFCSHDLDCCGKDICGFEVSGDCCCQCLTGVGKGLCWVAENVPKVCDHC